MRTVEDRKERGERSWALSGLTTYFVWLLPMSVMCSPHHHHHHSCHQLTVSYHVMSDKFSSRQ